MKSLDPAEFPIEFDALIAPWAGRADVAVLFGMVTSKNGWIETPYLLCPARIEQVESASVVLRRGGMILYFLPGLSQLDPVPDVMRGEEMQLFGLDRSPKPQVVVLPGTHSKWAVVTDGVVDRFRTIITGELFQMLMDYSIAGKLATASDLDHHEFLKAVRQGFESERVLSDIFVARSSVLLGKRHGDGVRSYLSGLLIGREVREGLSLAPEFSGAVTLVGSTQLTSLYEMAFAELGLACRTCAAETSLQGLLQAFAQHCRA